MLSILSKIFSRQHFEIFYHFSRKTGFGISNPNDLREMSNHLLWGKNKKFINLSSAEFAQRKVKGKESYLEIQGTP